MSVTTALQDLWRASWQGGLFIAAVFAICRLFRRLPASARHWLWWIACLQLPLRLLFFSPVAIPLLPATTSPIQSVTSNVVEETSLTDPSTSTPDDLPEAIPSNSPSPASGSNERPEPDPTHAAFPISSVLLFGWGVGVAAGLVLAARRLIRTRKLLVDTKPADARIKTLAAELSRELHLRLPDLRETIRAPCPLLAGWLHPTIVLPASFAEESSDDELRMALAHELAHLKRRDLWLAAIPVLTQSLFFFHPLAWLAVRESAAACEEACDVEALRLSGGSPSAYARLLLSSAQSGPSVAAMGTAFGFRLLHRRIKMLNQSIPLTGVGVRRSVTAVVALATICSIPWTVTAQSATPPPKALQPTPAHKVMKKPVKRHVKHPKRAVKKSPTKLKLVGLRPPAAPPATTLWRLGTNTTPATRAPSASVFGLSGGSPVRAPLPNNEIRYPATPALAPSPASQPPRGVEGGIATGLGGGLSGGSAAQLPRTGAFNTEEGLVITFSSTDIYAALEVMFKAYGINFSIKSSVRPDHVTCSLKNAPLDTALSTILKSVKQPLTFREESGVYMIYPKDEEPDRAHQ